MSGSESLMDLGLVSLGLSFSVFFPLLFFTHSVLSPVASVTFVWILGIVYKISEALTNIPLLQRINTFASSRSLEGSYPKPIDDWIHWELRFILFEIYPFLSISGWHSFTPKMWPFRGPKWKSRVLSEFLLLGGPWLQFLFSQCLRLPVALLSLLAS